MRELKLGEQLMPTPLVTAQVHLKVARACLCHCSEQHISLQVHFDWESRIQREQIKISEIFSKVRLFRSMHRFQEFPMGVRSLGGVQKFSEAQS